MKTLSFEWNEQDELVIISDETEVASHLQDIPNMFDKKAWLISSGWINAKIDGVRCWYSPENEVEKLEVMLAIHNFYYFQSDNIDVFNMGERYVKHLVAQIGFVSRDEAVALWNKYAPQEFQNELPE